MNKINPPIDGVNEEAPSRSISTKFTPTANTNNPLYITVDTTHGRLGNRLFQYAALRGIAAANGRIPVLIGQRSDTKELEDTFVLRDDILHPAPSIINKEYRYVKESSCCSYDSTMEQLPRENIILGKFLQSYKYFQNFESVLRRDFTFKPEVMTQAEAFFRTSFPDNRNATFVGIHVRNNALSKGDPSRLSTPTDYFLRAMDYFKERFPDARFALCCRDSTFCKESLVRDRTDAVISVNNSASVDLAILARCHHAIISAGTFGWWAGWLAGGDVVRYAGYPKKGGSVYKRMTQEDHFPPNWIARW